MSHLQDISCDCANFEKLRTSDYLYVDKTSFVHRIASSRSFTNHFLARPRRFGKSLLCSTFKALFEGKRHLFKGLAIDSLSWDWERETRPVISITMPIETSVEDFRQAFIARMKFTAEDLGFSLQNCFTPGMAFEEIILKTAALSPTREIAVIIDEYDAPLLHVRPEERQEMRLVLASIYGKLKDNGDCIRFLFITGITKFSKISIFSQLNNFEDLSLDSDFASVLGYTHSELTTVFKDHIAELAQNFDWDADACNQELTRLYDGFRFTEKNETVFNPFSIANVLTQKQMKCFWATSGTPTFLADAMRSRQWLPAFTVGETSYAWNDFEFFDLDAASPEMLLFQTGYLTIKDVKLANSVLENPQILLDFPNAEVRSAMLWNFFNFLKPNSSASTNTYAEDIRNAALHNDLPRIVKLLKSHFDAFAGSDTEFIRHYEGFYQTIITTILQFACCRMDYHQQGNLGIQDAAIYSADTIYIFELKVDGSPKQAVQQCIDKNYAGKYVRDGRKIKLVGLSCNSQTRSLNEDFLCVEYTADH